MQVRHARRRQQSHGRSGNDAPHDGGTAQPQSIDERGQGLPDALRLLGSRLFYLPVHDVGEHPLALLGVTQIGRKSGREGGHILVALVHIGIEGGEHDLVGLGVQLVPAQRRQHELRLFDGLLRRVQIIGEKRVRAREHLVGEARQGPLVGAHIERLLAHLLQGHVADGAAARGARSRSVHEGSQAEIGHLGLALAVHDDVFRLDIQMQGVLAVGHLQGMGDGRKHGGHHIQRDIVVHLIDDLRERLALDVFHDHVGAAAFHGAVVHGDDIRIRQLRDRASLFQAGDVLEQIQLVFGVGLGLFSDDPRGAHAAQMAHVHRFGIGGRVSGIGCLFYHGLGFVGHLGGVARLAAHPTREARRPAPPTGKVGRGGVPGNEGVLPLPFAFHVFFGGGIVPLFPGRHLLGGDTP